MEMPDDQEKLHEIAERLIPHLRQPLQIPTLTHRYVQTAQEALDVARIMLAPTYRHHLDPPHHRPYAVRIGHILDDVAYAVLTARTALLTELRRHDEQALQAPRQGVLFVVREGSWT